MTGHQCLYIMTQEPPHNICMVADGSFAVSQVTQAGVCVRETTNLGSQAREMQVSGTNYGGNGTSTPVVIRSQADIAAAILTGVALLQAAQQEIYLKIGECRSNNMRLVFCSMPQRSCHSADIVTFLTRAQSLSMASRSTRCLYTYCCHIH